MWNSWLPSQGISQIVPSNPQERCSSTGKKFNFPLAITTCAHLTTKSFNVTSEKSFNSESSSVHIRTNVMLWTNDICLHQHTNTHSLPNNPTICTDCWERCAICRWRKFLESLEHIHLLHCVSATLVPRYAKPLHDKLHIHVTPCLNNN